MAGARAILHALPTVQKMVVNFFAAALNTGYIFKEASFGVGSRALCSVCWQSIRDMQHVMMFTICNRK
jgi:hypothetical protein